MKLHIIHDWTAWTQVVTETPEIFKVRKEMVQTRSCVICGIIDYRRLDWPLDATNGKV